ncbi:uncharacterized protein FFB20_09148 [Fusarium fujikuroi]|uniref:Uncharacterized protein n=1 Tax=Gibberella fujikuroi (strain CBS 195.34 / IMI 58289 / NRRL A-6831) TaxID=1279085 RepID=S0EMV1_GIBF5|nr:uncharacterized protein FFUJ_14228 [Fusarium fujikuroi IMI 58289]KLO90153.1 uncharacterized protein Y057_8508 [Fusarium fujikuroi]KLP21275.1 uncharacterized protein LW94_6506 [Fusarium fujikuroi]CCT76141.1 uncharacterized protein FFUJ_14228 [Fusarium fujikuroi IMI 58289]SCN92116.1 uncharacterized protein FFB20_09148 [Fusarium fujikuroi]SCO24094.1 uncharacterized protein FFE2_15873 [Fusarium fujikuroi]
MKQSSSIDTPHLFSILALGFFIWDASLGVLGRLGQEHDELPADYRYSQGHSYAQNYLVLYPLSKHEYNSVARRKGVSVPPTTAALRHAAGTDDFHRAKESGWWASSCKDREPATASERNLATDPRPRAAISSSLGRRFATPPCRLRSRAIFVRLVTVKASPVTWR